MNNAYRMASREVISIYLKYKMVLFPFKKRFYLFIFRERGRKGEREGEKHQCVVVSQVPPTGDLACNPGMCLTGNRTSNYLVHRLALNPLSHTSQGWYFFLHAAFDK